VARGVAGQWQEVMAPGYYEAMNDNSLEMFEQGMQRADRLYRLYESIHNTRRRSIRSDWANSFEKLMRWKNGTAKDRIDGKDALIILHGDNLTKDDFSSDQLKDLLRGSLILAVSAMDAYFHRKISCHLNSKLKSTHDAPKKLKSRTVDVQTILHILDQSKYKKSGLSKAILDQLGYQSLQQPNKISDALSMIGITRFWSGVAKRMKMDRQDIESKLTMYAKRRNKIAHEGDISTAKKNFGSDLGIEMAYVRKALALIRKVFRSSEDEINDQLDLELVDA
jgi:hypothetical protein